MKKRYTLMNPTSDDFKTDSAYFHSLEIRDLVKSHRGRRIVKIVNPSSKKFVIRKVRTKAVNGLDASSMILDFLTITELGIGENKEVIVQNPSILDRFFFYYVRHPEEEIRFAYFLFMLSSFISISLTVFSN